MVQLTRRQIFFRFGCALLAEQSFHIFQRRTLRHGRLIGSTCLFHSQRLLANALTRGSRNVQFSHRRKLFRLRAQLLLPYVNGSFGQKLLEKYQTAAQAAQAHALLSWENRVFRVFQQLIPALVNSVKLP